MKPEKRWIIPADIILLQDSTGSNRICAESLEEGLSVLFNKLTEEGIHGYFRWRLITFKDLYFDGPDAIDYHNPFVSEWDELKRQFEKVEYGGGGDQPESILDALHISTTKTEWKEIGQVRRFILLFTDTFPHDELHIATVEIGEDRSLNNVLEKLALDRIRLLIVAPDHEIYNKMSLLPKSLYFRVEELKNLNVFFERLLQELQKYSGCGGVVVRA